MRCFVFAVLCACGGVSSNPGQDATTTTPDAGSFDDELPPFQSTLCKVQAQCMGGNETACLTDVANDMADAKDQLDAAGEQRCAECMHAKTRELQKILDASCNVSVADQAAVLAVCDLNSSDGIDKDDEACAGFP